MNRILPNLANPRVVALRLATSIDEYCRLAPRRNLAVCLMSRDYRDAHNGGMELHEIVRPVIFKLLFLPGLVIASLGQVW